MHLSFKLHYQVIIIPPVQVLLYIAYYTVYVHFITVHILYMYSSYFIQNQSNKTSFLKAYKFEISSLNVAKIQNIIKQVIYNIY